MTVRALVPLKRLSLAKSRLAGVLTARERRRLVLSMAAHVVEVVRGGVDEAILLAQEPVPELGQMATILDLSDDLNGSLGRARRLVNAAAGDRLLVVFADLPLLQPGDIAALIAASGAGLAVAPDRLGVGVNAIGFQPSVELAFRFGAGSRLGFEAEARRLGLPAVMVERPGLALDVDDADSLSLYAARRDAG